MSKLTVVNFEGPGELARRYFDGNPTSSGKPIEAFDIALARQGALDLYAEPARRCRERHCRAVTEEYADNIQYLKIVPKHLDSSLQGKVGIFYFGGGFITGSPELDLLVSAPIANALGVVMFSPAYPLAPEHPFPAALDSCVAFYKHVIGEYGAENVFVAGESAGANLAISTALRAHMDGDDLPCAVVAMSPVMDQSGDAFSAENFYQHDPALFPENIALVQRIYAPDTPLDDPLVSPHFAAYGDWFPPILFTTGTRDVFQHQVLNSAEKMHRAGVKATVHIWEGMWHVFEYYPELPEAAASIQNIADFVRTHL